MPSSSLRQNRILPPVVDLSDHAKLSFQNLLSFKNLLISKSLFKSRVLLLLTNNVGSFLWCVHLYHNLANSWLGNAQRWPWTNKRPCVTKCEQKPRLRRTAPLCCSVASAPWRAPQWTVLAWESLADPRCVQVWVSCQPTPPNKLQYKNTHFVILMVSLTVNKTKYLII